MGEIRGTINGILRHDAKFNSYKIALIRSLNDVVLSFSDIAGHAHGVAVPISLLAEYWLAYYWPFADAIAPVLQGPQALRGDARRNDMAFRPMLTALRRQWTDLMSTSRPADGYLLINEMRIPRKRAMYPPAFIAAFERTVQAIAKAIENPVRYAGPGGGQYTVFRPPRSLGALDDVAPLPGAGATDRCVVVQDELWREFRYLSLWIEALCIHEWSLFTEVLGTPRGVAYTLLTDRPDNRRPLTWERNEIDLLMMEGRLFRCPWTGKGLSAGAYDVDHIIPVSVLPFNDLWNLVPADPYFNAHVKRARIPSPARLHQAAPHLTHVYATYQLSRTLAPVLRDDVLRRFSRLAESQAPEAITAAVLLLTDSVAAARNTQRF